MGPVGNGFDCVGVIELVPGPPVKMGSFVVGVAGVTGTGPLALEAGAGSPDVDGVSGVDGTGPDGGAGVAAGEPVG
jgi:hypothetical protein